MQNSFQNPFKNSSPPSNTQGQGNNAVPTAPGGAWQNPFSKSSSAAKKNQTPEPTLAQTYIDPVQMRQNWDYKTATNGMFGEPLPDGAASWTPYGTPYFGDGISGKLKEYWWTLTKDSSAPKPEEWDALWQKWGASMEQAKQVSDKNIATNTPQEVAVNQEQLGLAVQTAKMAFQAGSANGSIVSPVLRTLGVGLKALGDVFNLPAQGLERYQGAMVGVQRAAKELGADKLPEFAPDTDNWFTRWINNVNPVTNGYAALKILFSPRKDKWDVFNQNVKEGWDAGRIYYSAVYDKTVQEEYLRRYRAGENPTLLAMELEKPGAEVVGQLILDPVNLLGVISHAKTVDHVMEVAGKAVQASGTLADSRAVEIVDEMGKLGKADDLKGAELVDEFSKIHTETVQAVQEQKLVQGYTWTSLTAQSNRNVNIRDAQNFIGIVNAAARGAGRDALEVADFIKAGVMSVSKNADEVRTGVTALMHFDAPKLMFSESGIKTFTMIRRMMETEDGLIDANKLLKLTKLEDTGEFMKAATDLLVAGAKTSFPTVDEMANAYRLAQEGEVSAGTSKLAEQFKRIPKPVLAANFLDGGGKKVYGPLNRVLGTFYFSLQGGVAVKNIIANTVQILVDQGPKAFIRDMEYERVLEDGTTQVVRRPAFWSDKKVTADLEKMLGFKTPLGAGFETQVEASKAGPSLFGKLMSAGETSAANRVVWSSMKDSMRKLMNPRFLGDVQPLLDAGMSQGQVNHFMRLLYDHAGDTQKALEEFRNLHGSGSIESWRTLDWLSQHYENGLHELDLYDEIANFAKNDGKSQADVENFFQKLADEVRNRGATAAQDGARITPETPGFESFMKLEEGLKTGDLTTNAGNEILRTWLVAANEAKNTYMESLQESIDWANRELPRSQAIQFSERMKALRQGQNAGLKKAEQDATDIIESARQWSQEIRNNKNPSPEWLKSMWKQMGLNGEPFADLTKQGLQITLWKYFRDQKASVWEKYYGTVFQESRSIVEDLGKVTDVSALRPKLTQAEFAVERANQLRSALYRKGTFYASPGKRDIFALAKQFGIETATDAGKPNDKMILNIINKYNGTPAEALAASATRDASGARLFEQANVANDIPSGSPLALIREHGGLNAAEFSDVMGGKLGTDKAGVLPGLFQKKGQGIDNVGRLLAEYGFMTEADAQDVNKVRDFIRQTADKNLTQSKNYYRYYDEMQATETLGNAAPYYDEAGNLVLPKHKNQQFSKLEDVPGDIALEAFDRYRTAKGEPRIDPNTLQETLVPAYPSGSMPSVARAWNENTRPAIYALNEMKNTILEKWGQRVGSGFNPGMEKALTAYAKGAAPKIAEGKAIALKAAEYWRDFILHNYGAKTYGDVAFAYAMPYEMWYARTYKNWMKRIVSDPHIVAGYAKYKDYLAKLNAGKSDFYRGQLEINGAFGIQFNHPLVFNLEAALNPLNGITGADFNDADRRVNWWSASLDDMNKFGPSLFAPLQWGVATALSIQGQNDAAQAWAGRAVPETGAYKSLANYIANGDWTNRAPVQLPSSNVIPGLKYGELDPVVNIFSGGLDKYERGRVGNALAQMVANKQITEEQAIDASDKQSGDIWNAAVGNASSMRAGTNLVSWLAGVGFKPRTEADQQIDSMFSELNVLRALNKDNRLTPDQYRQSLDALREKYKFMDAVILARRGGELRDSIYAYNVLGRLPPGASRDALLAVGLNDSDIQKFYDSKGFTDTTKATWTDTEKTRFMAGVADLGAMLELPDYATRTEWNQAKSDYKGLNDQISGSLGNDIWDKVSAYYDMRDKNPDLASQFKDNHPEIIQALQMRQDGIVNNPLLFQYYSSVDKLESYFDGKQRQALYDRYGDLTGLWAQYYDLKLQGRSGEARVLWRAHPELAQYSADKKSMTAETTNAFVAFASKLPDKEPLQLRSDFTPQTGTQEAALKALQPANIPTWQDVKQVVGNDISPAMETILNAYWQNGAPLSSAATKQISYLTSRYGPQFGVEPTNTTSFMRMLQIARNRQQTQPQVALEPSAGAWANPFAK